MNKSYAAIFDMDGVLVDTYQAHYQSWRDIAQAEGRDLAESDFAPTFGRTNPEVIACLWGGNRYDDEHVADLARRKEAAFRCIIAADFPAMPGARQLLVALHNAGFRLAIGSSAPADNVTEVLDKLQAGPFFRAVVTVRDVVRGKPDPEVFLLAAKRLQMPPPRCVVIEDAPAGVAAASAAGMASVGLISTGHKAEDLGKANLTVRSLYDLSPTMLRALIDSRA